MIDPKDLMEGAMRGTAKLLFPVVEQFAPNQLSERSQLARYELMHRGNPVAMGEFVANSAAPGTNPIQGMRDYEKAMLALRKKLRG